MLYFHISGKTVVAKDLYLSFSNSCDHHLLGMTPQVSLLLAAVQGSRFHMDEVFLSNFSKLLSMNRLLFRQNFLKTFQQICSHRTGTESFATYVHMIFSYIVLQPHGF